MICCIIGFGLASFMVAARRFARVRILRGEDQPDPADWRLFPESR